MNKVFITTVFVTIALTMLCLIKYYLYFYPRHIQVFIPAGNMTLYTETWSDYTTQNNICGILLQNTMVLADSSGFHSDDTGFLDITLANGKRSHIALSDGNFLISSALYQNTISWYIGYHLSPGNIK